MIIHMQELTSKGKTKSFDERMEIGKLIEGRGDVLSAGPLHIELQARGEEQIAVVEGRLTVELEMACSRCLNPVKEHIEIPFAERFAHIPDKDKDDDEEDEDVSVVQDDKVDLTPYVEQALLLALPYAPLCSEDCKGLCQECGKDLNLGECGCSRVRIDPRLAGLKDFFKS
jgi:uncharacterized protein